MHQAYGIYTNDTEATKNEQEERRGQQKIKALLYLAPNQSTKSAIDMEFPSLYLQTQNKDYKETRILIFPKISDDPWFLSSYNAQNIYKEMTLQTFFCFCPQKIHVNLRDFSYQWRHHLCYPKHREHKPSAIKNLALTQCKSM